MIEFIAGLALGNLMSTGCSTHIPTPEPWCPKVIAEFKKNLEATKNLNQEVICNLY